MVNVTLYSKPGCPPCNATKRAFEKNGVKYDEIDITADAVALEKVRSLGYQKAPIVITDNDAWSGFKPAKLNELYASLKPVEATV